MRWTQSFVIEVVFRRIEGKNAPMFAKMTADSSFNGVGLTMGTQQLTTSVFAPIVRVEVGDVAVGSHYVDSYYATPFAEGVPHRVRASWDATSTTLSIQLDKAAPISQVQTGVGTDAIGQDALIGRTFGGTFHVKADIAEMVAIAGATIAPADILMLQSYLDTKYGL